MRVAVLLLAQGKAAALHQAACVYRPEFTGADAASSMTCVADAETTIQAAGEDCAGLETPAAAAEFVLRAARRMSERLPRMSDEETRLWLQAYNAGPYALLRFEGNVPYRETRAYVVRVRERYATDLSRTPYEPHIVGAAARYGLDPQMVRAIMSTESDFRERCVSHAGARGLMQVMPCTWSAVKKLYGLNWKYEDNVFDPARNVEVACAYLAWLRYDFLPKHFAAFPVEQAAPPFVVRDASLRGRDARIVSWQDAPRPCQPASARQANGGAWFANKMATSMAAADDSASAVGGVRGRRRRVSGRVPEIASPYAGRAGHGSRGGDEAVEVRTRRGSSKRTNKTVAQKSRRGASRRARPES